MDMEVSGILASSAAKARLRLAGEGPRKRPPCGRTPLTKEKSSVVDEPNATKGDFLFKGCDSGTDRNSPQLCNYNAPQKRTSSDDSEFPASLLDYRTKVPSELEPEGRCNADLKYNTLLKKIKSKRVCLWSTSSQRDFVSKPTRPCNV